MEFRIENRDAVTRHVTVTIKESEVKSAADKRLSDLTKTVRLAGFRAGKAPVDMVRKSHGARATMEAIDKLINDTMRTVTGRTEFAGTVFIGQPQIAKADLKGDVVYNFDAEHIPSIEPKDYTGIEVKQLRPVVTEADVDAQIDRFRDADADIVPVEDRDVVQAGDIIVCDIRLEADGKPQEMLGRTVELANVKPESGLLDVVGTKRGDTATVEGLIGAERGPVSVTVHEIKVKNLPELNDAFAKGLEDGADTVAELRVKVRANLEKTAAANSEARAKRDLVDKLVAANPCTVPKRYVAERVRDEVSNQFKDNPKLLELIERHNNPGSLFPQRVEALAGEFRQAVVLGSIARVEQIKVEDADVLAKIDELTTKDGKVDARLKAKYLNPQTQTAIKENLLTERILDFLWSKANVEMVDELPAPAPEVAQEAASETTETSES